MQFKLRSVFLGLGLLLILTIVTGCGGAATPPSE
jgi:hypothetical protein